MIDESNPQETPSPMRSDRCSRFVTLACFVLLVSQCAVLCSPSAMATSPAETADLRRQTFGVPASISNGFGKSFNGFTKPIREIEVSSPESGRLGSLHVKRGDVVQKNQLMVELDTTILEASRRVAFAKSQATAQIDALVVEANLSRERHSKLRRLHEDGAGSIEEVRRSEADATVAALKVDAAREDAKLRALELAEIEARIELRRIRSPISGVVTDVTKDQGEYVSLQQPHLVTIVQLDRLRVTFFVPTAIAARVEASEKIRLVMPDTQMFCEGEIEHVGAVTQADSGRVRVDVLIDNRNGRLRSGILCQWSPSTARDDR